jgi:hypothetical protein
MAGDLTKEQLSGIGPLDHLCSMQDSEILSKL